MQCGFGVPGIWPSWFPPRFLGNNDVVQWSNSIVPVPSLTRPHLKGKVLNAKIEVGATARTEIDAVA